jgi:antitoxin PrlF
MAPPRKNCVTGAARHNFGLERAHCGGIPGTTQYATTITSKGQVTIPKAVRDLLGIAPGSVIEFERASDGRIVLVKLEKKRPTRFASGHAGKGLSTDEIMAMTRGER